jgi:hypothetical protein
MRQQNRDGQPTRPAPKPLDAFLAGAFRIGVAFVTSMPMNDPGTTTRTNRTQSFALFAADLDAEQNPISSRLIKSRSFGLHDAISSPVHATGTHPPPRFIVQRYNILKRRVTTKPFMTSVKL